MLLIDSCDEPELLPDWKTMYGDGVIGFFGGGSGNGFYEGHDPTANGYTTYCEHLCFHKAVVVNASGEGPAIWVLIRCY